MPAHPHLCHMGGSAWAVNHGESAWTWTSVQACADQTRPLVCRLMELREGEAFNPYQQARVSLLIENPDIMLRWGKPRR